MNFLISGIFGFSALKQYLAMYWLYLVSFHTLCIPLMQCNMVDRCNNDATLNDRINRLEPPCMPRPVVKRTDYLNKVVPRAVTVSECSGYSSQEHGHRERNHLCVPTQVNEFAVELCGSDGEVELMRFRNHTMCSMKCVCEKDGFQCTGDVFRDVPCAEGLMWNVGTCQCEEVSSPSTADRETGGKVTLVVLVVSLCGELVLFILFLGAVSYFRKHGCASYSPIPGHSGGRVMENVESRGERVSPGRDVTGSVSMTASCDTG